MKLVHTNIRVRDVGESLHFYGALGFERRGWSPTFMPAAKFVDLERAKGLVDGNAPVRVRRLQGKLPNEDILFM